MQEPKKRQWEKTKTNNLFRYVPTGEYVVRAESSGKTIRIHLKTNLLSVAKWKTVEILRQLSAGRSVARPNGPETFGGLADRVLAAANSNPAFKPNYKSYIANRLLAFYASWPKIKKMVPSAISERSVQLWAEDYSTRFSAANFNNTLMIFRKIMALAIDEGLLVYDPSRRIGRAKTILRPPTLPTQDQFHQIVAAMRNAGGRDSNHCADLTEFLAYSGMRVFSEASHVMWEDVNLASGRIAIRGDSVLATKNSKQRFVPINKDMAALLDRLAAGRQRPSGRILQVRECDKSLRRACRIVGCTRIHHHDLRHYFATRCIENGVDVPTVADWLGHQDGGVMLLKAYRHLRHEHSQAMAQRVDFGSVPAHTPTSASAPSTALAVCTGANPGPTGCAPSPP